MYHASHLFPIIQAAIFSAFLFTNFRILIKLYTLEKFILLQNWNELITPHPLITALPFHKFVYKYARDPHLKKKRKKNSPLFKALQIFLWQFRSKHQVIVLLFSLSFPSSFSFPRFFFFLIWYARPLQPIYFTRSSWQTLEIYESSHL